MDEITKQQLIEFAQQFFGIANAITAFSVLQAVALMYAFKDTQLVAAFLRWRPFTCHPLRPISEFLDGQ